MSHVRHSSKRSWLSSDEQTHEPEFDGKRTKTGEPIQHPLRWDESLEVESVEESYDDPAHQPQPTSHILQSQGWRGVLCELLHLHADESDHDIFVHLKDAFAELERLRESQQQSRLVSPTGQIIYNVVCCAEDSEISYASPPRIMPGNSSEGHLQGKEPILNLPLYLERRKDISFLVYRNLKCCNGRFKSRGEEGDNRDSSNSKVLFNYMTGEYIRIISDELTAALLSISLRALQDTPHPEFVKFDAEKETDDGTFEDDISAPYLWWFHRRDEIEAAGRALTEPLKGHFAALRNFIYKNMNEEWSIVDALLDESRISRQYLHYLFVPNTISICKSEGEKLHEIRGACANDWLIVPDASTTEESAFVSVTRWDYEGHFRKVCDDVQLKKFPVKAVDENFQIQELSIYPAKYAGPEVQNSLRQRGRMFWKCRRRNYVYSRLFPHNDTRHPTDSRFMIDFEMYSQMHLNTSRPKNMSEDERYSDITLEDEEQLPEQGDAFFMCLPNKVYGFNMQKKKWIKLDVEFLEDVKWNEEAFKQLVIKENTKELIQAVVTHQLQEEGNTDLTQGTGLFILLHGEPGTGKTLTAESVAEAARKPLYRITCGDIGTKAEEVEQYLEKVMLLGKTWDCVVLLDEADIFLEQRSLQNLERNAPISVFLRVLKYYNGIMILTSNRVGIFDEAFKSRIQLTLHYKRLEQWQRLRIWENFINHLERLEERRKVSNYDGSNVSSSLQFGLDAHGVRDRLNDLAAVDLNGREIRNTLSTARQLAVHRKQPLGYKHIEYVIEETTKFDANLLSSGG